MNYPKNKQPAVQQQPKIQPPNCPSCRQNNWLKFDKGYFVKIANILSKNRNII